MRVQLKVVITLRQAPEVRGFGIPFANDGHPSDGWVNQDAPILSDMPDTTIKKILSSRQFTFLITGRFQGRRDVEERLSHDFLPPPFSYPYGEDHSWDMARYDKIIPENEVCLSH